MAGANSLSGVVILDGAGGISVWLWGASLVVAELRLWEEVVAPGPTHREWSSLSSQCLIFSLENVYSYRKTFFFF